jgi:hypothetical protein
MNPRDMFNEYVIPALNDFEQDPTSLHRAVSALINIDALAEHVCQERGAPDSAAQFRDQLKGRCIELAYAWDVHDIHKHGTLTRRTPVLPNGRRPEVVWVGGAFQPNVFQHDAFQVGKPEVHLTLQDQSTRSALEVARIGAAWWDQELSYLGWLKSE